MRHRQLRRAVLATALAAAVFGAGTSAQDATTLVLVLRLADGEVTGDEVEGRGRRAVVRVRQGDSVELRWTSDTATELHLHGYDREAHATVDGEAVISFVADATGRFPIEAHGLGDRTVLYVEVLPR